MFYVYLYKDENNFPIYVGKGHGNRAWNHFTNATKNTRIKKKLLKMKRMGYNPQPEFLIQDIDEEFSFLVEEEAILKYGRLDLGTGSLYNLTSGGEGTSGYKHSDVAKDKIRQSKIGIKNHRFGTSWSEETRQKMNSRVSWNKGKTLSEEHKKKLSDAKKGKPAHNKGKKGVPRSEEAKLKTKVTLLNKKLKENINV